MLWKLAGAVLSKALAGAWKLLSHPWVLSVTRRKQTKALANAVGRAMDTFRRQHPALADAFFDEVFVLQRVGPEVEKFLRQSRAIPDPAAMAAAFRGYFQSSVPPDIERACSDFLRALGEELEAEEDLQEIMRGRAVLGAAASAARIAENTARAAELLDRICTAPQAAPLPEPEALRAMFAKPSAEVLGAPRTLPGGGEFVRPELAQVLEFIDRTEQDARCLVVLGEPGSGKTALLSSLCDALASQDVPFLAIKADMLAERWSEAEGLHLDLDLPAPVEECVRAVAAAGRCILVVDQLDALASVVDLKTARLEAVFRTVRRSLEHPSVRVVLSCRAFEYANDSRLARLRPQPEELRLELPPQADVEAKLAERSIATAGWSSAFKESLRVPQHLAIFLEVAADGGLPPFETYQQMLEHLWQTRVLRGEGADARRRLLEGLALAMGEDEDLWSPVARWDATWSDLERCVALGVLRFDQARRKVGFAHQTMFDFARARAFVGHTGSLAHHVRQRQEGLFVRPLVWSALTYLRGLQSASYDRELAALWEDAGLAGHLRALLAEFLGQQQDPTATEQRIVLPRFADDSLRGRLCTAVRGSPGWFAALRSDHLPSLMNGAQEARNHSATILHGALPFAQPAVLDLIDAHWLPDPANDARIAWLLADVPSWTEREVRLAEILLQRTDMHSGFARDLAAAASAAAPAIAPRIIAAALRRQLAVAAAEDAETQPLPNADNDGSETEQGLAAHMERQFKRFAKTKQVLESHDWYDLAAIAEADPFAFLQACFPLFGEAAERLRTEPHPSGRVYTRSHCYTLDGHRLENDASMHPLLHAFDRAAEEAASADPARFHAVITPWMASELQAVHRLILLGLAAIAAREPDMVVNYLLGDIRRFHVLDEDRGKLNTPGLLARLAPALNDEGMQRLEQAILLWTPHDAAEQDLQLRREKLAWNREARLRLLLALPEQQLSQSTRRLVREEARVYPHAGEARIGIRGGFIGSPVTTEQFGKASDEQIVGVFNTLPDATGSRHPRDWLIGGSEQAAQALAELAKTDPERIIRLLPSFRPGVHENPVGSCLRGLAGNPKVDSAEVAALIVEAASRGFSSKSFRHDAASAAGSLAERGALPDALCALLERWLADFVCPTGEEEPSLKEEEKDISEQSILFGMSTHLVEGREDAALLSALQGGLLRRAPPDVDRFRTILAGYLARNPDVRGRRALTWLFPWLVAVGTQSDVQTAVRLLSDSRVLRTRDAVALLPKLEGRLDTATFVDLAMRLASERSRWFRQAAGELFMLRRLRHPDDAVLEQLVAEIFAGRDPWQEPEVLIGCVHVACVAWPETDALRRAANGYVTAALRSESPLVTSAGMQLFWRADPLPRGEHTREILSALVENPTALLASRSGLLVDRLAEHLPHAPDLVCAVAEALVARCGGEFADIRTARAADAPALSEIAVTLHRMPGFRERGLALFESLLDLQVSAAAEIVLEIDRRTLRQAPQRPVRRRSRQRRQSTTPGAG